MKKSILSLIFLISFSIIHATDIEFYPNYHTIGINIVINNNDDPQHDAVVTIEYREHDGEYQKGFPPTRISDTQIVGSLFGLKPGVSYDVKLIYSDETGPYLNGRVEVSTISTRSNPVWKSASHSYYVSPQGSGEQFTLSNPGSLHDAVTKVRAGEEVVLLGGVYYDGNFVLNSSGDYDAPITIRGKTGEKAILDGSDTTAFIWQNVENDIYMTTINVANTQLVVAEGNRLYGYKSYEDLKNRRWNQDGFYCDENKLYINIPGKNPNNLTINISKEHRAFNMYQQDYFHFRNLTFRYYGQGNWAKALYFHSSSHNVVDNCIFAINNLGIGLKRNSNQVTIQNCEFYDTTEDWDWDGMKATIVESTLIGFYDPVYGRGNVIRNNIFHNCMDGISTGSFYDNESPVNLDIYNNLIYKAGDDGISVDGNGANIRVWNNTIHDVLVGISFAPVVKGPAYAIRNVIYNTGYGNSIYRGMSFKFNSSGYGKSGKMYLFHNTCDAAMPGVDGIEFKVPGNWNKVYSRNNAFTGTRYALSYLYGDGDRTLDMDYDNLYTKDSSMFVYWTPGSHHYSNLQEFQEATDMEKNGISLSPQFVEPDAGNFKLQSNSKLINAAVLIPGINNDFKGFKPDIGAYEYTPVNFDVLYVDNKIAQSFCDDYSVQNRSCGNGTKMAFNTISAAAAVAKAGNYVHIRQGKYSETLSPQNSGTKNSYITFNNYNSEEVIITGESLIPAINLNDKQYIWIEGLKIDSVRRWLYGVNAHYNIILDNTFSNALDEYGSSKTGLFFQEATHNKIINNIIENSTQDNLSLIKSDYNLIEDNIFTNAEHALWVIKCGNYNVIRKNTFYNENQKAGEIYDCEDAGFDHEFNIQDATKHNLIEYNTFSGTSYYYSPSGGNGIQYAAQNGIIRFNTFYDNNVGIGMQYYEDEALYNKHNKIYHNVFYRNKCGGIATDNPESDNYFDNEIVNNIFYKNIGCEGNKPFQHVYKTGLEGFFMRNNDLFSTEAGENVIGQWQGEGNTIDWFESNYPAFYSKNIEINPLFADTALYDFHLQKDSKLIDTGDFLTATLTNGSGREMHVKNAGYFFDGYGIKWLLPDTVKLESGDIAVLDSVDYNNNILYLDRPLNWMQNEGISLKYYGNKPDLGLYEYRQPLSSGIVTKGSNQIDIFPNPAKKNITISVMSKIEKIEIFNQLGYKLMERKNTWNLDISPLKQGLYYIRVKYKNGNIRSGKMVKI